MSAHIVVRVSRDDTEIRTDDEGYAIIEVLIPTWTALLETERSRLLRSTMALSDTEQSLLWHLPLIENPKCKIYGKECTMHRSINFFSDSSEGYRFSGQLMKSVPTTMIIRKLFTWVERATGGKFNGLLVNLYSTGEDYISAHSDAEEFLSNIGVVAISMGSSRTFRIRDKKTKKVVLDHQTSNLELLWMAGDFQKEFTHEIPTAKTQKPRLSLTFRYHTR